MTLPLGHRLLLTGRDARSGTHPRRSAIPTVGAASGAPTTDWRGTTRTRPVGGRSLSIDRLRTCRSLMAVAEGFRKIKRARFTGGRPWWTSGGQSVLLTWATPPVEGYGFAKTRADAKSPVHLARTLAQKRIERVARSKEQTDLREPAAAAQWPIPGQVRPGPKRSRRVTAPTTFTARIDAEARSEQPNGGGWRSPRVGRRRSCGSSIARREAEAKRLPTLRDYAEQWIDQRRNSRGEPLRPLTRDKYRTSLRVHICPSLGDLPLDEITRAVVRSWYDRLNTGATARAHAYSTLRTILNTAVPR